MIREEDEQAMLNLVNDMKTKLNSNIHKRHHSNQSLIYLFERLDEELSELKEEINKLVNTNNCMVSFPEDKDVWEYDYESEKLHILMECADIANFVMMIHANVSADRSRGEYTLIK